MKEIASITYLISAGLLVISVIIMIWKPHYRPKWFKITTFTVLGVVCLCMIYFWVLVINTL